MKHNSINSPVLMELKNTIENSNRKSLSLNFDSYKKFLFLLKKYPTLKAVPTKAIDEVWHCHFENKELYAKDCISYFGHIIKHKEFSGQQELVQQEKNYQLTNKLWALNFNTQFGEVSEMAFCGVDGDGGDDGGNQGGDK